MPNWCECFLEVAGPATDLASFAAAAHGSNCPTEEGASGSYLWFDSLLPTPEGLKADGWYEWRLEHWGTKWNAEVEEVEGSPADEYLSYYFMTAWSPPEALLRHVSGRWPALEFLLSYAEAGMNYSGQLVLKGGQAVRDDQGHYGDYYGD